MTYTLAHIDRERPPKPTRFLNIRVLCGLCRWRCCNSPSLGVELTPEESKRMELPIAFPIAGRCRCLGDAGCSWGAGRPVLCKLFPAQIKPDGNLVCAHWNILNCPTDRDYTFVGMKDGRYVYARTSKSGPKANNSAEGLSLDKPLTDYPTVMQAARPALVELYGEDAVCEIERQLRILNDEEPVGFGLNVKQK